MKQSSLERRLRNTLKTHGYSLHKDPARLKTLNHQGGYQIVDENRLVAGENFDLTLKDVLHWVLDVSAVEGKEQAAKLYPRRQSGGA